MSKLYLTESGHVIPTLCEELTAYRRARKVLNLPATENPASLYILARSYPETSLPLCLAINGRPMAIEPRAPDTYQWYTIPIDPAWLIAGENTIDLWSDATAMNAWSLAMEAGHAHPRSLISDDSGQTWRDERMGYLNTLRGEYVIRLRLVEGHDSAPPAMAWEDPANPRLESLRALLPAVARADEPMMKRVRSLSSWLASSWEHTGSSCASQYAPWDAETIIAWGAARSGHAGQRPIVMCVHYAIAFVSCCQAIGIAARPAVLTGGLNGWEGHFVAEVWFEEYAKWVMVDPNVDAIFWKAGAPLSVTEIQSEGSNLAGLIEWGPGAEYQRQFAHVSEFIRDILETGACCAHRGIWPRADFLSHPELSPPAHGTLTYCEAGLVWEARDLKRGFGMFPYFGDQTYFDAPPAS